MTTNQTRLVASHVEQVANRFKTADEVDAVEQSNTTIDKIQNTGNTIEHVLFTTFKVVLWTCAFVAISAVAIRLTYELIAALTKDIA